MIKGQRYRIKYRESFNHADELLIAEGYYSNLYSYCILNGERSCIPRDRYLIYITSEPVSTVQSVYKFHSSPIIIESIVNIEKIGKSHFRRLQQIDGTIESRIQFYLTMCRPDLFGPDMPVSVCHVQGFMNIYKNLTGGHTISI